MLQAHLLDVHLLSDRLHTARESSRPDAADAARAYVEAIKQADKGNAEAADWWRMQEDFVLYGATALPADVRARIRGRL